MYGNWANAAMALYRLEGIETRLKNTVQKAHELFDALNQIPGITIKALPRGTNIYNFALSPKIDCAKTRDKLNTTFNIRIGRFNDKNESFLTVNETLLYQDNNYIINAFKKSVEWGELKTNPWPGSSKWMTVLILWNPLIIEIGGKCLSMSHHAHLKQNEEIAIRPLASVIPIGGTREKSSKHKKDSAGKAKKDLPLFYTKPIFKAKEHDPLWK